MVTVHYRVMTAGQGGETKILQSTENQQPLRFVLGQESVIDGFHRAVVGMSVGESKSFTVLPEQAFGCRRDDFVWTIDRSEYPRGVEPQLGQRLELPSPVTGARLKVRVTQIEGSSITVDANHPLAGFPLTFEVLMLEIA
jgi:FKBP-type peptidyl-prolyl cis-trans isomerase 2